MFHSGFQANIGPMNPGAAAGLVRRVQTVTFNPNGTDAEFDTAITAVDMANAYVVFPRYATIGGNPPSNSQFRLQLTSSTNLRAARGGTAPITTNTVTFDATVLEFEPGIIKSIQRGTITIGSGSLSNTATISEVNTAKAFVNNLGTSTDGSNISEYQTVNTAEVVLTSGTLITASKANTGANVEVSYEVVEFY